MKKKYVRVIDPNKSVLHTHVDKKAHSLIKEQAMENGFRGYNTYLEALAYAVDAGLIDMKKVRVNYYC